MKSMNVEQILQLALRWEEEQAPPPPDVEWVRRQLLEEEAKTKTIEQAWWREKRRSLWKRLEHLLPELPSPAEAKAKAVVARRPALGTIPALVLRNGEEIETALEITQKPRVSSNGRLVLGVRAAGSGFRAGETVELITLAGPAGEPVGPASLLLVGKEELLALDLSAPFQEAWRDMEYCEWGRLPFRFVLRPSDCDGAEEERKGEAAGGGKPHETANQCPRPRTS